MWPTFVHVQVWLNQIYVMIKAKPFPLFIVWKDAREKSIVLNPSFMPRPYVMGKLTCSELDPISRKFIGEHQPLASSSWPSGVSTQFSHHECES